MAELKKGQVWGTGGGVYRVRLESGDLVDASLRGRLKLEDRAGDQVVIGDEVHLDQIDGHWVVEDVEPRRTEIVRSRFGGRTVKALVANIDRLLVVASVTKPKPNPEIIDRLLVLAEHAGVELVLLLNKVDLPKGREQAEALADLYSSIGYRTVRISAVDHTGVEEFDSLVREGISALAGPSGVGKSTLVNAIEPELELRTGSLSRKTDRGRHTTVSSRLIPLGNGGLLADTPGFSDVGVWGAAPESLAPCFPEFRPLIGGCRFSTCTHRHEPDCRLREAVADGTVHESRYTSYLKLWDEAEAAEARERGHS